MGVHLGRRGRRARRDPRISKASELIGERIGGFAVVYPRKLRADKRRGGGSGASTRIAGRADRGTGHAHGEAVGRGKRRVALGASTKAERADGNG